MLTRPMLLRAVLLALLLAVPLAAPRPVAAIAIIPEEPGVVVLPTAAILQTVAADVDDDGQREVVRLVRGPGDAVLAEVWGLDADGWRLRGEPAEVVQASRVGTRIDRVYQSTPVRMLVRRVAGVERVTVASQPHFDEIDVGEPCCLIFHDLAISDGAALVRPVSGPGDVADAIIVIDLDGDSTDELLSTRSLPPAGDIGFPIEARVHRWVDGAFASATQTPLPVGSGDSPFRLGDSDGLPGEEAAIISSLGPSGLFRIRLVDGDRLALDAAGLVADQAVAVPVGDGRGVALVGPLSGLVVAAWPAGAAVSEPSSTSSLADARILGTVSLDGQPALVAHQPDGPEAIHLLELPSLRALPGTSIDGSSAAAALSGLAAPPFSGPLPGGGADGDNAIIHDGRLIPSGLDLDGTGTSLMATLAGAEPVGLVGAGDLIVLHHRSIGQAAPRADGGPLVMPAVLELSWTSIAPLQLTGLPESDAAAFEPPVRGALALDARNGLAVGAAGFTVEVTAPPGSRIVIADTDPSVVREPLIVRADGQLDVPIVPSSDGPPGVRQRVSLLLLTPAGHAHLASWDVEVLTEPPAVDVTVSTPIGASAVEISGRTARYATVRIDGRAVAVSAGGRFGTTAELPPWPTDITIEVDDGLGNVARQTVTGIGLFDYRGLPWVPMTVCLVALVAFGLFLRVPRSSPLPRRADDDAALEELEPD